MGTHPIFESDFDCLTEIDGSNNKCKIMKYFVPLLIFHNVRSSSECFQPQWFKPKRMEKKIFYEPSGNEFSVKCKIKGNLTEYQNGPVMWFQHLGIIGKDGTSVSHDSI